MLENNGEHYREALKRAKGLFESEEGSFKLNPGNKGLRDKFERAEKRLNRERISETRLFAIDAGLDSKELREIYKDRTRYVITKGLVRNVLNVVKTLVRPIRKDWRKPKISTRYRQSRRNSARRTSRLTSRTATRKEVIL